jgi:acyl dehydratase
MAEETKIRITLNDMEVSDILLQQIRGLEQGIAGGAAAPLWRHAAYRHYADKPAVSDDGETYDADTWATLRTVKHEEESSRRKIEEHIPPEWLQDKKFNKTAYIDIIRAYQSQEDAPRDTESEAAEKREHEIYEDTREYLERQIARGIAVSKADAAAALTFLWSRQDAMRGLTGIPQEIRDTFKTFGQRFEQPVDSWRAFDSDGDMAAVITAEPQLDKLDKLYSDLDDTDYAELRRKHISDIYRDYLYDRLRFSDRAGANSGIAFLGPRAAGRLTTGATEPPTERATPLLLPYYAAQTAEQTVKRAVRIPSDQVAEEMFHSLNWGNVSAAARNMTAPGEPQASEEGEPAAFTRWDAEQPRAQKSKKAARARTAEPTAARTGGSESPPYTGIDTDWGLGGLEFEFSELDEYFAELNAIEKRLSTFINGLDKFRRRGGMQVLRSAASGVSEYARFQGNAYRAVGRLRPFDFWSYPETLFSMGQQQTNFQRGIGNNLMGIGSGLMMSGNPVGIGAGAATSLFGGGMTLLGSLQGIENARMQGALGLTKNIFAGVVGGLETLLSAARTVGGGLITAARQIVGAVTHLLGAGLGLGATAFGAGTGIVTSVFNQDVRWSNPAFTGVSLREQLRNEHLEDYWYLGRGRLQTEIVNWNRKSSEFRTQGVFERQVPTALSGMLPLLTSGRTGFDALYEAAQVLAETQRHASRPQRLAMESWFAQQGLDIVPHMAGQLLEGRDIHHRYYAYANQEQTERAFREHKVEYDALTRTFADIVKDIGNALWNNKLPLVGVSGRQVAVGAANVLGSVPAALRGDASGLLGNARALAGFALGGLDAAGKAFDGWLGRLGFEPPAYRLWRESEPRGRAATAGARAAWLDSKPLDAAPWAGPWQKLKQAGAYAAERGLGLAEVTLTALKSGHWTPVWNHIAEGVKPIADSAGALISSMFRQGQTILGSLWTWIGGKITAFFASDFPQTLMQGFHTFSTWMHETLQGVFDDIDTGKMGEWFKDLGAELIYAFEPAIRFIGRTLYSVVTSVANAIAYSKNPFSFKSSPFTLKNEPFLTEQTGRLYKKFYDTVLHDAGYRVRIGGALELDPLQALMHNTPLSRKVAESGALLTTPNVSKETLKYNFSGVTQDDETIELLYRMSQVLRLERVPQEQLPGFIKVLGDIAGNFDKKAQRKQEEMLGGEQWRTIEQTIRAGNSADAALDVLMPRVKARRERTAETSAARTAPDATRVEASASGAGAANRVLTELERRIAELTAELKALQEEHARPLRGYVDLRFADGSEHRLEITQEALAGLFSGARGNNPYTRSGDG